MDKSIATIKQLLPSRIRGALPLEMKVVSLSPNEMRKINAVYQREQKPTSVLSFRYDKEYGEILICPSMIRKEARSQKHSFRYQMTWMILHGMLHLAGMHHEKSRAMAKRVDKLERVILKSFFLKISNLKTLISK